MCVSNVTIDSSRCPKNCEGMEIISYDQDEMDSKLLQLLSKLSVDRYKSKFEKDPIIAKKVSKLSDQYSSYKESYNFPTNMKSISISTTHFYIT